MALSHPCAAVGLDWGSNSPAGVVGLWFSRSDVSSSCDPMGSSSPGSSLHGTAPLSLAPLSRQEYWSGLPFPSPGNFPTQGSNSGLLGCRWSPVLQVVSRIAGGLDSLPTESPGQPSWGWGRRNKKRTLGGMSGWRAVGGAEVLKDE